MRADRLLSILMLLQTRKRMTAHDLAQQLEVSERTIYRDLEALSSAGFPVYTERGPRGGCSLLDGYQTKLNGLTEAELRVLFLCTSAHSLTDLGLSQVLESVTLKLATALPVVSACQDLLHQRVHIDTTAWHSAESNTAQLSLIQDAIWHEHQLLLNYRDADGYCEYRIEPYGLVSKAGEWYLVGGTRDGQRVVRVSHIHTLAISDETFIRPADFDLARSWAEFCTQHEQANASDEARSRHVPGRDVPIAHADAQHNTNSQRGRVARGGTMPSASRTRSYKKKRPSIVVVPSHLVPQARRATRQQKKIILIPPPSLPSYARCAA